MHLSLTESQRREVTSIYANHQEMSHSFCPDSRSEQARATELLDRHDLTRSARAQLENRWNTQWSTKWRIGKDNDHRGRFLFQWYLSHE
jgi:hypothetical protein